MKPTCILGSKIFFILNRHSLSSDLEYYLQILIKKVPFSRFPWTSVNFCLINMQLISLILLLLCHVLVCTRVCVCMRSHIYLSYSLYFSFIFLLTCNRSSLFHFSVIMQQSSFFVCVFCVSTRFWKRISVPKSEENFCRSIFYNIWIIHSIHYFRSH